MKKYIKKYLSNVDDYVTKAYYAMEELIDEINEEDVNEEENEDYDLEEIKDIIEEAMNRLDEITIGDQ